MPKLGEFERYIKQLCEALGHRDRHGGFADYSRGLMLPIERKSVEPLAAHTDPLHVRREASVAASLGGAVGVVGQSGFEVCARLGHAQAGAKEQFLLDRG